MKSLKKLTFLLVFVLISVANAQLNTKDILNIKLYNSFDKIYTNSEFIVAVKLDIKKGWHINSNKPNEDFLIPTKVTIQENKNFVIDKNGVAFPKAENIKLAFSDTPLSVWQGEAIVGIKVKVNKDIKSGNYKLVVNLQYQACNDNTCLAPDNISDTLNIVVVDKNIASNKINESIINGIDLKINNVTISENDSDSIGNILQRNGLLLGFLIVFLGGLALNLTPCVYPLIPITVGYFGGQSEGNTKKLFLMGLLFVFGMAITYSIIGVVTALTGAIFGTLLQSTFVIIAIVLILLIVSLSMFGVYEFKLPDKLVAKVGGAKSGMLGAFFMGLTMGVVAAPCIGPFLIGLVSFVAAKGDPVYGFSMFFVLALGLGLPYLFLAVFSGKIKNLPKAGDWMDGIKHIFGLLLIGLALYFLLPILPKTISDIIFPVFLILSAIYLLFIDRKGNNVKAFKIFKIIFATALIFVAAYQIIPSNDNSIAWQKFNNNSLITKNENNKPIFIDFYADWCIPCKELDYRTFNNPKVIELSKSFNNYKADLTHTLSPEVEKLRTKYKILGVPTLLFLDKEGNEVKRLTGFISPEELSKLLIEFKEK